MLYFVQVYVWFDERPIALRALALAILKEGDLGTPFGRLVRVSKFPFLFISLSLLHDAQRPSGVAKQPQWLVLS